LAVGLTLVAAPRDDFLTRRRPEGGAGLTSEGASLSVLTRREAPC
jgi:hypothetical protein